MAHGRASSVASDDGSEYSGKGKRGCCGCCGCGARWWNRFSHQKLAGRRPVLTARSAQAYFICATVLCIALGVPILVSSLNVVHYRIPYAFEGPMAVVQTTEDRQKLLWAAGDEGLAYNVSLAIDKDMQPPVYVFFELSSFFQNYRRYVRSFDATQMHDGDLNSSPASACRPFAYLGPPGTNPSADENSALSNTNGTSGQINPCGQIAQSLFNDTFEMSVSAPSAVAPTALQLDESNIAWSNDHKLYGNFIPWNYNNISEWRGGGMVNRSLNQAQHWMVWMRTAGQTVATKLYAQIDEPLLAGSTLNVRVSNRYNTYGFQGEKSVIVTTNSWVGGRNLFLGIFYLACAGATFFTALFFFLAYDLNLIWKRQPGRLADLSWVRDQPDELTRASSVADLENRFADGIKQDSTGNLASLDDFDVGEGIPTGAAADATAAAAAAGGKYTVKHIQADGKDIANCANGTGASGSGDTSAQTSSDQEAPAAPQQQQGQQQPSQHLNA